MTEPNWDPSDYSSTGPDNEEHQVSGVFPNNTYPLVDGHLDEEQERRLEARQESEWAAGDRATHPPLTRKFPNDFRKAELDAEQPGA